MMNLYQQYISWSLDIWQLEYDKNLQKLQVQTMELQNVRLLQGYGNDGEIQAPGGFPGDRPKVILCLPESHGETGWLCLSLEWLSCHTLWFPVGILLGWSDHMLVLPGQDPQFFLAPGRVDWQPKWEKNLDNNIEPCKGGPCLEVDDLYLDDKEGNWHSDVLDICPDWEG